jgi:hypothetical protein
MANPKQGGKNMGLHILWKIPFDGCFGSFIQLKLRVIILRFVSFQKWLFRVTRDSA